MELPNIGAQCSFLQCSQLDFLPIQCPICELLFCKLHIKANEHGCVLSVSNTLTKQQIDELDKPESFACKIISCKMTELAPIICDFCKEQFCLKHRLPVDHECTSILKREADPFEALTTREKVKKVTGRVLSEQKTTGRVGKRSNKTSNKVLEMKLKMKAKGETSIPGDERVYFNVNVVLPQQQSEKFSVKSYALFFSCEHTVGRVIDLAAKYCSLKNENHISTASKLRFYIEPDNPLPTDARLKDLLCDNDVSGVYNFGEIFLGYFS